MPAPLAMAERQRFYRKIIRIRGEDSPNVRLAFEEMARGLEPSHRELVPGVLSYHEYVKRRTLWDKVKQCVGLDAQFYEGPTQFLYPADWLNAAERYADSLRHTDRIVAAIGCDPAEGTNNTSWSMVDPYGLVEQVSLQTPDTTLITDRTIVFIRQYGVPPEKVILDSGGGGKQVADELRRRGYPVRTVAFGEPVTPDPRHGRNSLSTKIDDKEHRYVYVNKRALMYGTLRILLKPDEDGTGRFGIPARFTELRRQLGLMPLLYDKEGRMRMLPKRKKSQQDKDRGTGEQTLEEILGCSPDESDSLVLAVHAMTTVARVSSAGVIGMKSAGVTSVRRTQ